jgi:hypothetical protein
MGGFGESLKTHLTAEKAASSAAAGELGSGMPSPLAADLLLPPTSSWSDTDLFNTSGGAVADDRASGGPRDDSSTCGLAAVVTAPPRPISDATEFARQGGNGADMCSIAEAAVGFTSGHAIAARLDGTTTHTCLHETESDGAFSRRVAQEPSQPKSAPVTTGTNNFANCPIGDIIHAQPQQGRQRQRLFCQRQRQQQHHPQPQSQKQPQLHLQQQIRLQQKQQQLPEVSLELPSVSDGVLVGFSSSPLAEVTTPLTRLPPVLKLLSDDVMDTLNQTASAGTGTALDEMCRFTSDDFERITMSPLLRKLKLPSNVVRNQVHCEASPESAEIGHEGLEQLLHVTSDDFVAISTTHRPVVPKRQADDDDDDIVPLARSESGVSTGTTLDELRLTSDDFERMSISSQTPILKFLSDGEIFQAGQTTLAASAFAVQQHLLHIHSDEFEFMSTSSQVQVQKHSSDDAMVQV